MEIDTVDLGFQDAGGVTASFLLLGDDGATAALVETGPATCLSGLMSGLKERGVSPGDVRQIFLTHVHLDHAGAAGHLSELLPNATFYVHEIGHRHLADPTKLVDGATRVYGEKMEELWGEVRPVPEGRLTALFGGEELEAADGVLVAHHTPGHAYHHLAYLEPDTSTLFVGDVAGIRLPGLSYVRPPTSPPDLDPQAWKRSIALIHALSPASIRATHFGHFEDVDRHLDELDLRLEDWLRFGQRLVDEGHTLEDLTGKLSAKADAELTAEGGDVGEAERYRLAGETWVFVAGLWHYLMRHREGESGS